MTALVPYVPAALVDKLAKVAGLLGSDHDGERSAAAFRATALIRDSGLNWSDVIRAAGPRHGQPDPEPDSAAGWRHKLQVIIDNPQHLTPWESEFVLSVLGNGRKWKPSEKQAAVLDRIYRKVAAS